MITCAENIEEMKEVASRICREYLTGTWKTISKDEIRVKRISGGLSNFLYHVSLPESSNQDDEECSSLKRSRSSSFNKLLPEPKEVLLRIYGQIHGEQAMDTLLTDSVVFTLLSERNLGPKLHGIFPGGRIEQYIPARPLKTHEMANSNISVKIAQKMAQIHSMNIPISKDPEWLWKTLERWLLNAEETLNNFQSEDSTKVKYCNYLKAVNLRKELNWYKNVVEQEDFPVAFCHNDLQEGNILFRDDSKQQSINNSLDKTNLKNDYEVLESTETSVASDPKLMIIDYEYCAYNYRGFDIANHFLEWTMDYTNNDYPHYYYNRDNYPTADQQNTFISAYVRQLSKLKDYEPSNADIADIINEVRCLKLASHLFWSLWSIINVTQLFKFGYWEYAVCRIEAYFLAKMEYLNYKELALKCKRSLDDRK